MTALWRLRYFFGSPPLDNFVFKLCYRWTTLLLVVFSFVVTCRLLLGNSFDCVDSQNYFPKSYMTMKCYDNTVFIRPKSLITKKNESATIESELQDYRIYQSYYSWVNLLFLVQAFLFYLPHMLWKSYEQGYVHRLTAGVQNYFDKEEKRALELCYFAKYFIVTQGKHKLYTVAHIFLEVCNFTISVGQTVCLVHFFGVTGVPNFIPYTIETWAEFKEFYFPSTAICQLSRISPSGVTQRIMPLCQLPLNSLYMKMFLFLFPWYIVLTLLCGFVIVYRVVLLAPSFRTFVSKMSSPLSERSVLTSVCCGLPYTDWFFLSMLQKSMTDIDFAQMMDKIAVASQSKDEQNAADYNRFSMYDNSMKELDSSNTTSPL